MDKAKDYRKGCGERMIGILRRMPSRRAVGIIFLLGMLLPSMAAAAVVKESDVKAAFILNFIKFVEWPVSAFRSPESPIVLVVLGNDPVADSIASLDGRKVSGRRVIVRKVPALSALERCHLLFVGASEKTVLAPVLGAVQRRPVLTVGDFDGFVGRGGTIGFIRLDNRVGFEINEESARKAGLKINAKLLYLGKNVRGRDGGER